MASYPFYRIGFWIRETGQALDKLGCFFQGNGTYAEQGARFAHVNVMRPCLPLFA